MCLQKALRHQRSEVQDLMVALMTVDKGVSVDPAMVERVQQVRFASSVS
jgi:hypothetical protein